MYSNNDFRSVNSPFVAYEQESHLQHNPHNPNEVNVVEVVAHSSPNGEAAYAPSEAQQLQDQAFVESITETQHIAVENHGEPLASSPDKHPEEGLMDKSKRDAKKKPAEPEEEAITSLNKLRYSRTAVNKGENGGSMETQETIVGQLDNAKLDSLGTIPNQMQVHEQLVAIPIMEGDLVLSPDNKQAWKCVKCDKNCKTKSSLNTHMNRKHAETKEHACHLCRKSYAIKDSLTKHLARKHSQLQKSHQCTQCSKNFPTQKEKMDHMNRHSKEKTFACDYPNCTSSYTTKNSLNLHIARNHKEAKYQCTHCGEKYAVKGDLNQHQRRKHGIFTEEHQARSEEQMLQAHHGGDVNNHEHHHHHHHHHALDLAAQHTVVHYPTHAQYEAQYPETVVESFGEQQSAEITQQ